MAIWINVIAAGWGFALSEEEWNRYWFSVAIGTGLAVAGYSISFRSRAALVVALIAVVAIVAMGVFHAKVRSL